MGSTPFGSALQRATATSIEQRLPADSRVLAAAVLVTTVALAGRFFDPSLPVLQYAGLLAGALNAPRTDKWETATTYAVFPGLLAAFAVTGVLAAGIPLGYYHFPFFPTYQSSLDLIGPFLEFQVYAVLFAVEGWLSFAVVRKITGPAAPPEF